MVHTDGYGEGSLRAPGGISVLSFYLTAHCSLAVQNIISHNYKDTSQPQFDLRTA